MRRAVTVSAAVRTVSVIALLLLGYLGLLAVAPQLRDHLPLAARWFGAPGSWQTIAIVVGLLALLGLLISRPHGATRPGATIAVVVGLALTGFLLGMTAYWNCYEESRPRFFTALAWTAALFTGNVQDLVAGEKTCPWPPPVALDLARLLAATALFLSVLGVAATLFQSRLDRLRAFFAPSVTAVVDIDDDAQSMLSAIAQTLDSRSVLVLITASPDDQSVHEARNQGARVVSVDFNRPDMVKALTLWRKVDRLYLLSADPSANLLRLSIISERMNEIRNKHRLPLIMRIDDPWQAQSWRAQHFGGAGTLWAADAVGMYEVTARRLLDRITATPDIDRVVVCGTSRLTLALCSDVAQRQLERTYANSGGAALPRLVLVAEDAEEYAQDHAHSQQRLGISGDPPRIDAVNAPPSVSRVASLLDEESGPSRTAVIIVDADGTTGPRIDATTGTRLAVRFPGTPIYAWDPNAEVTEDRWSIVGRLKTYRLSMDMPQGQAQDAWERAARLIHDRYALTVENPTPATVPWSELSEFYRGSNRRQVRNALWMVEQIGGHTWDTWGCLQDPLEPPNLRELSSERQLELMGFDLDAARKMAEAEHKDWCRYYRSAGWRYGPERDDDRKIHNGLVDWATIEDDPRLLKKALGSLATTLVSLRELGYRSRHAQAPPEWRRFRRVGTVIAHQRARGWTWTSRSGQTMIAEDGDWEVRDAEGGRPWSVRDDIFRANHHPIDGSRWRRNGIVRARPARDGETVDTLEGPAQAHGGDWVVQGEHGEQWPVPTAEFQQRYEPLDGPQPEFRI